MGGSYQGAGSFNPMTPAYARAAGQSSGFAGRGVTSFVRGIPAYAGIGGFGGWEGNEYTGLYGETTIDYTYPTGEAWHPHAVTARSNGDTFSYDANGNMTSRTQDGVTWTQVFDAENRLVSVSNNATPSTTTTYVYDGGGGRLKRIVSDGSTITTTLYVAGMEIETEKVGVGEPIETKRTVYYPSGGAFRVIGGSNAGLYYRHGDHLGSTSVLSDSSGMKVSGSDVVYAPFGEVRSGEQSALTDFGYTGQRKDDSTGGLMYYNARYYLPGIQHFVSADTIVPGPANPQAFNRYSYVLNNPVMLIDPSGHYPATPGWVCQRYPSSCAPPPKVPANVCASHPSACGENPPAPKFKETTNNENGTTTSTDSKIPEKLRFLDDQIVRGRDDQILNGRDSIDPQVTPNSLDPQNWNNPLRTNTRNMSTAWWIIWHRKAVFAQPRGRQIWVGALTYYSGMRAAEIILVKGIMDLALTGYENLAEQPSPAGPKPPGWTDEWEPGYGTRESGKDPRWFDPGGGEWRWHEQDKHHPDGHWDHNPWETWNNKWKNVVVPTPGPTNPSQSP